MLNSKAIWIFLIAVVRWTASTEAPNDLEGVALPKEARQDLQDPSYAFSYMVQDQSYGVDFGHREERLGYRVEGEYFVVLPNGQLQRVNYYADETGYHPLISYENTKQSNPSNISPNSKSLPKLAIPKIQNNEHPRDKQLTSPPLISSPRENPVQVLTVSVPEMAGQVDEQKNLPIQEDIIKPEPSIQYRTPRKFYLGADVPNRANPHLIQNSQSRSRQNSGKVRSIKINDPIHKNIERGRRPQLKIPPKEFNQRAYGNLNRGAQRNSISHNRRAHIFESKKVQQNRHSPVAHIDQHQHATIIQQKNSYNYNKNFRDASKNTRQDRKRVNLGRRKPSSNAPAPIASLFSLSEEIMEDIVPPPRQISNNKFHSRVGLRNTNPKIAKKKFKGLRRRRPTPNRVGATAPSYNKDLQRPRANDDRGASENSPRKYYTNSRVNNPKRRFRGKGSDVIRTTDPGTVIIQNGNHRERVYIPKSPKDSMLIGIGLTKPNRNQSNKKTVSKLQTLENFVENLDPRIYSGVIIKGLTQYADDEPIDPNASVVPRTVPVIIPIEDDNVWRGVTSSSNRSTADRDYDENYL